MAASACRRRRQLSTWRRCTACALTFLVSLTTIGSAVAISTSRGPDTQRGGRGQAGGGRRGIFHGGSAYGCVSREAPTITSSAFTSLTRSNGGSLRSMRSRLVVAGWVFVKSLDPDPHLEVAAEPGLRLIAIPPRESAAGAGSRSRSALGVGAPVLHAGGGAAISKAGARRDPACVNYLDYDVPFGARLSARSGSRRAMRSLRRVDSADPPALARGPPRPRSTSTTSSCALRTHAQARCLLLIADISGGRRL